jgi:radical SAM superfamily enzyme YgiQ (UPF0313 family)
VRQPSQTEDSAVWRAAEQAMPAAGEAVQAGAPTVRGRWDLPAGLRRLEVFLIRPTKYDAGGYLLRHLRGVLPSTTLGCLRALTDRVRAEGTLGAIQLRTHLCDESVSAVPQRRIRRLARRAGTKVLICLVGVQTNQFPRASDLARRFRARGLDVLVGGFHVSGSLVAGRDIPADLQRLLDDGVTLVSGEVEETWGEILVHAAAGTLSPLYNFIDRKPVLSDAPVPRLDRRVARKFVYRHFATLDAGRGCPFTCSFCTIINVQGRTMRSRHPVSLAAAIETGYADLGTHHFFFTDDNFARNPGWRAIFGELIRLREHRHVPVRFLMQVDVLSHRIPEFISLAKRAGCFQVFIGMESLNPESLNDAEKRQNRVGDYAALIEAWHCAGILTHVGYIIGFPHDTPGTVRDNLRALTDEVRPDIASFFMLTPLPGSQDYARYVAGGTPMDLDLNDYDTFHPVMDHPTMTREEWFDLYQAAWREFYSAEHMSRQLRRVSPAQFVTLLQMYLWYAAATTVDRFHPMMTGFVRLKPRTDRRPGRAVDGLLRHLGRRVPEIWEDGRRYLHVLRLIKGLWADARLAGPPARSVCERRAFDGVTSRPGGQPGALLRRAQRLAAEARLWNVFRREMFGNTTADRRSATLRNADQQKARAAPGHSPDRARVRL